jgi:pilus assembly protein CpaD
MRSATLTFHPAHAVLIGCALLAGCASSGPLPAGLHPVTPTEQYSIQVQPAADEIQLAPHGAVSAGQQAALAALVMRWREYGEGALVIQATADPRSGETAQAAAAALQALGVAPSSIRIAALEGAETAPVKVGFQRYVAVGPQCANQWGDLVRTAGNAAHAAFGCTITANMAAQIADPRDLVAPQAATPADSRRRVLKANGYHAGKEPVKDE